MTDLEQKLAHLSPEKRKLLALKLKQKKAALKTFPVSYAQQRLWFLDQFEPGSPYYNIPIALKLSGPFDIEVFKKAIQAIIDRHEALRTTFISKKGEPFQAVTPMLTLQIPVEDISHLSSTEREDKTIELATQEARKPFNLEKGPLMRVSIIKKSDTEHVILLTMHHIISDGWSIGVLVTEITRLYDAFSKGQPSPLPKLQIQYPDYAVWQKKYLEGKVYKKQLNFWKEHLGSIPPALELPTDRPRPAVLTNAGSSLMRHFSKEITAKLNKLSRQNNATLFMTLIAACKVLLSRLSGQTDISIGTPIANRTRGEVEGLIGLFINTLVLYTHLDDNPSFSQLISRVRETTVASYENQDLPFEYLVDALQPDRDMSVSPLFQVMFILQNAPSDIHKISDLTMEMIPVDMGTSTFDLTFSATESPIGLVVSAEYNTDLFDRTTIERFMDYFEILVKNILINPDQRIANIPILDGVERQKILFDWNDYHAKRDKNLCIHHLFEKQVEETPEAPAVFYSGQTITYNELNKKANQMAHYLKEFNIGPDIPVGILLDRSVDLLTVVLGVLKTGSAYLPLDPSYPEERLQYMLEDADVPLLITQESLKALTSNYSRQVLNLNEEWDEITVKADSNPDSEILPENLVYLIYTSGSTGQSKGTMVRHRSLVNAYLAWEEAYELRSKAKNHLQMASFSFDVFSGDWTRALCSGGKLVLAPREILLEAEQLYNLMINQQIDTAEFVPAVLRNLIQYLEKNEKDLKFMYNLIAGSDVWYIDEYNKFRKFCGSETRLINSYGLTEATIDSTFFEADSINLPPERLVPIGRPFDNMSVYILDDYFEPVPAGVRGELFLGGDGLSRGYLNRPDLTADKFIPNPFSEEPGERLYRTGDQGRYLPNGSVEFLGRADNQVKLRGFRIELGEIENALSQHKQIKDAVVIAREDTKVGKRLVAYIVSGNGSIDNISLKSFLIEQLPDYMVPSAYVHLDKLPLTPNGKVDRKALPAPDQEQIMQDFEKTFVAPSTPTEKSLANIWMELLDLKKVGIIDNFFDLGGHSLIATQLTSRIRDTFDVELALRELFLTPTISELAKIIAQLESGPQIAKAPPIIAISRVTDLPLSYAQQRLWFLDQLEPESPFYNIPDIFKLQGPLQINIFETVINEIVKRHEILRTTIHTVDGKGVQRILPKLHIDIPVSDFSQLDEHIREDEALRIVRKNAQKPFPLHKAPLFRIELYKLSPDEHLILFVIHHIISDDWSSQVLIRELVTIYDAFIEDRPNPLQPLPFQYADFASWQRNWLQGAIMENQLAYWKEQLSEAPPVLELPTDRPRPSTQTFNGSFQTFKHSEETTNALNEIAKSEGATLFMTLLAAFQVFLFRYSGQINICVGTPIASRNRSDLERLIGFFVNTLVLHIDLSGKPSFREVIQRAKTVAMGAYSHQDIPFEKLVDTIQPERNMSHSPLFQVMFTLQTMPSEIRSHSKLSLSPVNVHSDTAKFDLTLFVQEHQNDLSAALEYNTDLFDDSTIMRMIAHFTQLVDQMLAHPDAPITDIEMISADEKQLLLQDWNGKEKTQNISQPIFKILESKARSIPDYPALEFGEHTLTYAQLNNRANQLANYLISQNIKADDLIGLSVHRSIEMVVSIFGILKAGAAYVPIDPAYPGERLEYILQDSGVKILISEKELLDTLPAHNAVVLCVDRDRNLLEEQSSTNPQQTLDIDNLAYMIYTSGSTGKPKGTLINHRGLINYLDWCDTAYPIQEGRGSLVHSTIAFDATVSALFSPILAGKTITLIPETQDLEALSQALRSYKDFSLIKITPAHLALLSNQIPAQEADALTKAFVIGGENLTADQIQFWQEHAPTTKLFNEYGPTETVVGCVVYEALSWRGTGSVPIGQTIGNTEIYILDESLFLTPVGIAGELCIGGEGLARGYHNRPDLTAEKFIPNPYSERPGSRLYKTGDLVRYLNDGQLEFLGRIDSQVKIRGYRIELGEIETALSAIDDIHDAIVIVHTDTNQNKKLIAYCVPEMEKIISTTDLRMSLKKSLPDYMIPALFVELQKFPLTPNGKIDYKALPEPDDSRPALQTEYVAASTENEKILTEIWRHLLNVKKVGMNDNFFELGGDSIIGIQMISQARQVGLQITPVQIFQHQTIAQLAGIATVAPIIEAEQGLVSGEVPLTPIQNWFFEQPLTNRNHWNQSILLKVNQSLDTDALRKTVQAILQHHDALRLRFSEADGKFVQTNAEQVDYDPLLVFDMKFTLEVERSDFINRESSRLQASLNLTEGDIFKVVYFDAGADPGRVLIVGHHLAIDGVSWRIILEDFQLAYSQIKSGQEPLFPQKTTSYKEWASALIQYAKNEIHEAEQSYWQNLSTKERFNIVMDSPRGANTEEASREISVTLTADETSALLTEVPPIYNTRINDILLAALVLAYEKWSGKRSILLEMEGHGREQISNTIDVSRTVGWFTSIFPVYLELGKAVQPRDVILTVKEQLSRIPNNGIGFGLLRFLSEDDDFKETLNRMDHAPISFNYLGQFDQAIPEESVFSSAMESRGAERDPAGLRTSLIDITGAISEQKLSMSFSFSTNLFLPDSIQTFANAFKTALQNLIVHCKNPEAGGRSASDFKLADLDDKKLDKVMAQLGKKKKRKK